MGPNRTVKGSIKYCGSGSAHQVPPRPTEQLRKTQRFTTDLSVQDQALGKKPFFIHLILIQFTETSTSRYDYGEDPNLLMDPAYTIDFAGPNETFNPKDIRFVNWRFIAANNAEADPPVSPTIETFALSYRWLSAQHPDPDGFHLAQVASVLQLYLEPGEGKAHLSPLALMFKDKQLDGPVDCLMFWECAGVGSQTRAPNSSSLPPLLPPPLKLKVHGLTRIATSQLLQPPPEPARRQAHARGACAFWRRVASIQHLVWPHEDGGVDAAAAA